MSYRRWLPCSCLVLGCARGPGPDEQAAAPIAAPAEAPSSVDGGPAEGTQDASADAPLRLVEVAPGIFAALQPPARRFADANGAVVVTDAGVVVIDGPQRLAAAQWLMDQAEAMTEAPRRVHVTTHWHLDHSLAAAWWDARLRARKETLERWGHAELAPRLATEGLGQLQERRTALSGAVERGTAMQAEQRRPDGTPLTAEELAQLGAELGELRREVEALQAIALPPPEHLVIEPTTLELGAVTLELIPLRAHTDADLVVHVPEAGVLVTGDVLDEIPFAGHGRPRRWLAALQRLRALRPAAIIPGHGSVLGPEHLDVAIELWEALLAQAMLATQRGETAEQRYAAWEATPEHQGLRQRLVTDPVSERAFAAFVPEALARTMADLRGDLDPPPGAR